jgi:putative oxidoreductase
MEATILVARILFALIFIGGAPRHFTQEGISHAADLGVPWAPVLVPASGLLALLGGVSVMLGFHARLGAWMLVAFLVPVTLMMHAFWTHADPVQHHTQLAMFMKNVSLLGAALLLSQFGAGAWSVDGTESPGAVASASMHVQRQEP